MGWGLFNDPEGHTIGVVRTGRNGRSAGEELPGAGPVIAGRCRHRDLDDRGGPSFQGRQRQQAND
jgi:hypothetical protein